MILLTRGFLAVIGIVATTSSGAAQDGRRLRLSSTFRCEFPVSASGNLRSDVPSSAVSREKFELVFDNVSVANGKARMIGNNGGADIVVSDADDGITLLEPLESGLFQMTVIYAAQTVSGRFKAVHSRHSSIMGTPLPSQYYGSCVAFK